MTDWDGEERRQDNLNIGTRLVLLEYQYKENKDKLDRIIQAQEYLPRSIKAEIQLGFNMIVEKDKARNKLCDEYMEKTDKLENDYGWIYKWLVAEWAVIVAGVGIVFHHTAKK